jgi:hypothetical protein
MPKLKPAEDSGNPADEEAKTTTGRTAYDTATELGKIILGQFGKSLPYVLIVAAAVYMFFQYLDLQRTKDKELREAERKASQELRDTESNANERIYQKQFQTQTNFIQTYQTLADISAKQMTNLKAAIVLHGELISSTETNRALLEKRVAEAVRSEATIQGYTNQIAKLQELKAEAEKEIQGKALAYENLSRLNSETTNLVSKLQTRVVELERNNNDLLTNKAEILQEIRPLINELSINSQVTPALQSSATALLSRYFNTNKFDSLIEFSKDPKSSTIRNLNTLLGANASEFENHIRNLVTTNIVACIKYQLFNSQHYFVIFDKDDFFYKNILHLEAINNVLFQIHRISDCGVLQTPDVDMWSRDVWVSTIVESRNWSPDDNSESYSGLTHSSPAMSGSKWNLADLIFDMYRVRPQVVRGTLTPQKVWNLREQKKVLDKLPVSDYGLERTLDLYNRSLTFNAVTVDGLNKISDQQARDNLISFMMFSVTNGVSGDISNLGGSLDPRLLGPLANGLLSKEFKLVTVELQTNGIPTYNITSSYRNYYGSQQTLRITLLRPMSTNSWIVSKVENQYRTGVAD